MFTTSILFCNMQVATIYPSSIYLFPRYDPMVSLSCIERYAMSPIPTNIATSWLMPSLTSCDFVSFSSLTKGSGTTPTVPMYQKPPARR